MATDANDTRRTFEGICLFYNTKETRGGYWAVIDESYNDKHGQWSPLGLHYLQSGDHIAFYSPDDPEEVLWEGEVDLYEFSPFTEKVGELWIHSVPQNMSRYKWAQFFLGEYPAIVIAKAH